jgi:uncharacterized protein
VSSLFADAASLVLLHQPVPADQIVAGDPTTGYAVISRLGDHEMGVWEMSVGAMSDVETDEVFVVLAGAATIAFTGTDGTPRLIEIGPGWVGKLTAGLETVWTVTETLRKVYVA